MVQINVKAESRFSGPDQSELSKNVQISVRNRNEFKVYGHMVVPISVRNRNKQGLDTDFP